ncbi:hypothetical protein [Pyrococcus sp. ST04]|uniref:hypothetical protein n=1 Tax=Pyrococcus sp. ST04 TaxID=1183377 RepID=UPI00026059A3|nr:hypothetical protein [Pyrococcus sp. ST04]AFK21844.1 hypothetical protein Py04_0242 [Pyrococcus sp. ST04]
MKENIVWGRILIEELKKVRELHRNFEGILPRIGNEKSILEEAYQTINEEIRLISQIADNGFKIGKDFENTVKETLRLMIQMKGMIEEAMLNTEDLNKFQFSIKKIIQFNRNYDYLITENLNSMITYAEFIGLIKEGGIPSSILEKISNVEKIFERFEALIKFLKYLYHRPSDVFKVEFSIRKLNEMGLKWIEIWHLEKETGISRDEIVDILDGLALIGVIERMERGGESVYRLRDLGED